MVLEGFSLRPYFDPSHVGSGDLSEQWRTQDLILWSINFKVYF